MENCEQTVSEDGTTTIYTRNGRIIAKCVKNDAKEKWYNADGKLHRDGDLPAAIYCEDDQKIGEVWYYDGKSHRVGGPAAIWYENGQKIREFWYRHGKIYRDDGPADIWYENGQITIECWYRDDKFDGNVLAYIWLANTNNFSYVWINDRRFRSLDEFRDAVKGPLALELMRPLPIPIRAAIYEHYCLQ